MATSDLKAMSVVAERPHGYARYRHDKCRCLTCRRAVSQYNRTQTMAVTAGTWRPYVDAEPVRQHVQALMASGIGWRRVAELADASASNIKQLLYGKGANRSPSQRVRPELAAKVLAVRASPGAVAAGMNVDATGTRRRIQALACLGWTLTEQAGRIGWTVANYSSLLQRSQVLHGTAEKVRVMFDELSMTRAAASYGSTRIRNLAVVRGWKPPLAWDEDRIDNPRARPLGTVAP